MQNYRGKKFINKNISSDIMETKKRSIVKAVTFRVFATISALIMVLVYTGDWKLAGIVGAVDAVSKTIIYYAHERVWSGIEWGIKHKN